MRLSIRTALLLFVCAFGAPVFAQSIAGTWQGTLSGGPMPRVVVRFKPEPEGKWRGFMSRPDRWGPKPIPMASVEFQGAHLKFEFGMFDIRFDGAVAADGKTIAGNFSENKQTYPLTLRLAASPDDLWIKPQPAHGMDPHADPSFEVATVKPSLPGATALGIRPRAHNFQAKNATVYDLIHFAFDLQDRQMEGAPAWFRSDRFDINAEADTPGSPSDEQTKSMVRKLLAERFALKFHMIQKDFPVLALRFDKLPAAVTPAENPAASPNIIWRQSADAAEAVFQQLSMHDFCGVLMYYIPERQVVDETGISGRYDFVVRMPPDTFQRTDQSEVAAAAIDGVKKLGFRLEAKHAQLEVIVIDHLDKPSAN